MVLKLAVVTSNGSIFSCVDAVVVTVARGAVARGLVINLVGLFSFCFLLFGFLRRPPFLLLEDGCRRRGGDCPSDPRLPVVRRRVAGDTVVSVASDANIVSFGCNCDVSAVAFKYFPYSSRVVSDSFGLTEGISCLPLEESSLSLSELETTFGLSISPLLSDALDPSAVLTLLTSVFVLRFSVRLLLVVFVLACQKVTACGGTDVVCCGRENTPFEVAKLISWIVCCTLCVSVVCGFAVNCMR